MKARDEEVNTVVHDIENDQLVSIGQDAYGEVYLVKANGTIDKITRYNKPNVDQDGDGRSDLVVYRPSNSTWYSRSTKDGSIYIRQWGSPGDAYFAGEFDGDNKLDYGYYNVETQTFYINYFKGGYTPAHHYGSGGILPAANYFGFGIDLPAYGSVLSWRILWTQYPAPVPPRPSYDVYHYTSFYPPAAGRPVPGAYYGNAFDQAALFDTTSGTWYIADPAYGPNRVYKFGEPGDIPTPGDFDDDGFTDIAVYRPSNQTWYFRIADDSWWTRQWGEPGDIPVVADYDGDGKDDIAQYRPSTGYWYVIGSTSGPERYGPWGEPGDIPVATFDRP